MASDCRALTGIDEAGVRMEYLIKRQENENNKESDNSDKEDGRHGRSVGSVADSDNDRDSGSGVEGRSDSDECGIDAAC